MRVKHKKKMVVINYEEVRFGGVQSCDGSERVLTKFVTFIVKRVFGGIYLQKGRLICYYYVGQKD